MKKIFIITLILFLFFTCASVCASDFNEMDVAGDNQNDDVLVVDGQDNGDAGATEKNELTTTLETITDLANDIENANDDLNLTNNVNNPLSSHNSDELKQTADLEELRDSNDYYTSISVNTNDISKYDNYDNIKIKLTKYKSSGSYVGVAKGYTVSYIIADNNNKIVYSKSLITDKQGTCNFESNFNVFKNLAGGKYTCSLSTTTLKSPYKWSVYTPVGTHDIIIYSGDYTNFKSNSNNLAYVYLNSTHVSAAPRINYTIKNSKDEIVYTTFINCNSKVCTLESNYNIFKNLSDDSYTCSLTSSDEKYSFGLMKGTTFTWKVLVDRTIKNTPASPTTTKANHYTKYIKVGIYKIPVWSDDSLNTQKNKVIKYLKTHVKKGHTFKIHGYKFRVSAKNYCKILYYKKYGYDGKMGFASFKAKTNRYYTLKKPIYKTKKVTKKVWVYKNVLRSEYWSWDGGSEWKDYNTWEKYTKNGWTWYGTADKDGYYGDEYYSAHYYKLKKKVKKTVTKKTVVGYKKIKVRVYAWSVESKFKVGVQFRAGGQGHNQPITGYYFL